MRPAGAYNIMDTEKRFSESLSSSRNGHLEGVVMRYGTIGQGPGGMPERFEPGAFGPDVGHLDIVLYGQHDKSNLLARTGGGGLTLADSHSMLGLSANLGQTEDGKRAWQLVMAKILRGLSIEFHALDETISDGVRVVRRAQLTDLSLVTRPAYAGSTIEARALSGRTLRARIPVNKKLDCRCSGPACKFAKFAGEAMQSMFREAFEEAKKDVVASFASYDQPLASVARKTIRGRIMKNGDGQVDIDIPAGAEGDAVLRAHENAGVIVRPFLDADASESVIEGETRVYAKATARAFIVSASDAREGWPPPVIRVTDEQRAIFDPFQLRRRVWL